jgi:ssDNA-binding Zn-finger/Zn-ribbon topoisomerase 1
VTLITPPEDISPFIVELLGDPNVEVVGADLGKIQVCPQWGKGVVVTRSSRYGQFVACSTFPRCEYKESSTESGNGGRLCPVCRTGRLRRHGRYGPFLGCTSYPDCDNTQNL